MKVISAANKAFCGGTGRNFACASANLFTAGRSKSH
jgi:hypothetical protein